MNRFMFMVILLLFAAVLACLWAENRRLCGRLTRLEAFVEGVHRSKSV